MHQTKLTKWSMEYQFNKKIKKVAENSDYS